MSDSLEQEIRTLRAHFWSDRDPDGRAFAPLADAYRRKGDLAEAESLVQDGLGRLPDFATGRLVAALVQRDQGRLDDAASELDRLLELDPANVVARVERAGVAVRRGDPDAAREDARRALEIEPGNEDAAGVLRELDGPSEEEPAPAFSVEAGPAEEVFEEPVGELEGLELDGTPEPEGASDPDEGAEPAGAEPEEAAETPAPATAAAPPGPGVYTRTLGELYARQGFPDRAVTVFERLLEESPGDPELEARLAELREAAAKKGPTPPAPEAGRSPEDEDRAPQWLEAGAAPGEVDTAFAWSDPEGDEPVQPAGRPIRGYLQSLVTWVPGAVPIASLAPEGAGPVPIASLAPDDAPSGTDTAASDDLPA